MSNKSLEQALATMLPSFADSLPPELVRLAANLLAQSRSYGSALKPDEEIARPYACAEIACRKLGKTLKLPPLMGRAPCPPRLYRKLYGYLEQALAKAAAVSSGKRKESAGAPISSAVASPSNRVSSSTPTPKRSAAASNGTPSSTTNRENKEQAAKSQSRSSRPKVETSHARMSRRGISGRPHIPDAPAWTMPIIRQVCKVLTPPNTPNKLPPHLFAGLSSVLTLACGALKNGKLEPDDDNFVAILAPENEKDGGFRNRINTLVVALYLVVSAHRAEQNSEPVDVDQYISMSRNALDSLGVTSPEALDEVDVWLSLLMTHGWTKGQEWFDNIPITDSSDEHHVNHGDVDENDYDDVHDDDGDGHIAKRQRATVWAKDTRGGLLPGLGTMMQPKIDWLSDEKRAEYRIWKRGIMAQIHEIEKAQAHEADANADAVA